MSSSLALPSDAFLWRSAVAVQLAGSWIPVVAYSVNAVVWRFAVHVPAWVVV